MRKLLTVGSLALAGCVSPVLSPVHPMTALPAPSHVGLSLNGGLGSSNDTVVTTHDAKVDTFFDGDLHLAPVSRVDLSFGGGFSALHPLTVAIPGGLSGSAALKVVLLDLGDVAVAVAPRASGGFVVNNAKNQPPDTATALQLPLLASVALSGGNVLTVQGWYRRFPTLQSATEDITLCLDSACSNTREHRQDTGHGVGGSLELDLGPTRGGAAVLFVSVEGAWLDSGAQSPHLLYVGGLGLSTWFGAEPRPPLPPPPGPPAPPGPPGPMPGYTPPDAPPPAG